MHTSSNAPAPLATAPAPSPSTSPPQRLAALWARPLILLSFLAIVFLTLFPFNFTVPHGMTLPGRQSFRLAALRSIGPDGHGAEYHHVRTLRVRPGLSGPRPKSPNHLADSIRRVRQLPLLLLD